MIHADSIKVDNDDGRITLVIDTDEYGPITIDIHSCAIETYAEIKRGLGPYVHEAEVARAFMVESYDSGDAYALDDPKHPTFYERMVD